MATIMIVTMKSGRIHKFDLDKEVSDISPEEAAKEFYKGIDFASANSLRIENKILVFSEIESFTFE